MTARGFHGGAVLLALFSQALPSPAQNITGTILGTVTDATGASVPGATVTVTSRDTGQISRVESNQFGYYEAPQLRPGGYGVQVAGQGFKTLMREAVSVQVESRIRLDFILEVGDAAASIAVTGEAPLIESETASLGQVIAARTVQELPIRGRNVFDLVSLSPGVQVNPRSQGAVASTGDNSAPLFVLSDISINGGRYRTNEYMLDGVSIMLPENNNFAISPSPDGTQEFKVMTNSYGPQFGRSGGGVINVITRGGSNRFQGTLYEFFRNDRMRANNYFANARGQKRGIFHFNQFGAAVGGPIVKNKTFFFADFQGHRERSTLGGQFATLPAALQRAGDFSQTFNAQGQPVAIHDPFTTRAAPSGTGFVRDAFPGNRIPANRFDPVAVKMLSFVPLPNTAGSTAASINNLAWAQQFAINSDQWSMRLDHRFSDRHGIFGRVTRNKGDSANSGPYGTPADNVLGITLNRVWNAVLNDTVAISPSFLLNVRYGISRRFEGRAPLHAGEVTLGQLGFPGAVEAAAPEQNFPTVSFATYSQWGPPGGDRIRRGNDIHTIVADVTKIAGRHTVVAGADGRLYNQTPYQAGSPSGSYSFSQSFTQGPDPLRATLTAGDALASLLTGFGAGSISSVPALAIRNSYFGLYVNDEIKLGRLTVNVGLRYDHEAPRTERYNRFTSFDFNRAFPIQVAGLTGLKGVLTHPGQAGEPRSQFDPSWTNFGPRLGMAYRLNNRTAIRSGYGIFYSPKQGTTSGQGFGASGYELATAWVASLDGVTPLNPVSNPFPTGLLIPPTARADVLQVGQAINIHDRGNKTDTYTQHWNFSVQRELSGSWLVETGYAGNKGTRLPLGRLFNQLDPKYQALGADLNRQVANPFFGLVATGTLAARTVAQSQLLRPYPQYVSVGAGSTPAIAQNAASSVYHSVLLRVEKRFSSGVNISIAYTGAKLIDNASGRIFGINGNPPPVQNNYDLRAERSLSEGDVARRLVVSHTIDLPFGKGRRWLSGAPAAVNLLAGGWSVSGAGSYASGVPLALTSTGNSGVGSSVLRPNSTGKSALLSGDPQTRLNRYFDTSAFTVPDPFTFGNLARTLPDVRAPARVNYDMALSKSFALREPVSLLFRAEAFNLTNTPYFLSPGLGLGTGAFGVISGALGERQVQFSVKLLF